MVPVAGIRNGYDVDFHDSEETIYWVEHPVSYCSPSTTRNTRGILTYKHVLKLYRSQFRI